MAVNEPSAPGSKAGAPSSHRGGGGNGNAGVGDGHFALDIGGIRKRARDHIDAGAVTAGYRADRLTVLQLLNDSLATELVCVLRYRRHYFMSAKLGGIGGFAITQEFLEHANQEQQHADKLAERIVQLGGEPEFDPRVVAARSHTEYAAGKDLKSMLVEDLIAERIAIETYGAIIRYLGDADPTTRRLFEGILEQEEEHADEISDLLGRLQVSG
jgi:bacterioferritin